MNYQRIYDNLIFNAKQREVSGYTEMHHIVPRCMGGDNSDDNLIRLTSREHFIAHELLFKIHRTSKLAHAWFSMLRCDKNQQREFTSRQYARARKAHSEALKISMKGANNHFYGKRHTEETKRKISEANKGNSRSPEQIQAFVDNVARKPKSKEHRAKIGRKGLVMLKNVNTGESVRVDKETANSYNRNIWKNPLSISQKREKCIYCDMETTTGNIKRWHNENCKHNPDR